MNEFGIVGVSLFLFKKRCKIIRMKKEKGHKL